VTTGAEVEELRERTLLSAEREAREAAVQSGTWLGFLVLVALVSLVFLSRALQRQVLFRLETLRDGVGAIVAGEHRRLWEQGNDELTLIARHVNGLLDRYEELQGRTRGRLAQERRLVLGLLRAAAEGPAALYDPAGQRLAGELEPADAEEVVIEWIRDQGRRLAEEGEPVTESIPGSGAAREDGDEDLEAELLLAPNSRPAGWLVRAR
jgi:hypothetical protein